MRAEVRRAILRFANGAILLGDLSIKVRKKLLLLWKHGGSAKSNAEL